MGNSDNIHNQECLNLSHSSRDITLWHSVKAFICPSQYYYSGNSIQQVRSVIFCTHITEVIADWLYFLLTNDTSGPSTYQMIQGALYMSAMLELSNQKNTWMMSFVAGGLDQPMSQITCRCNYFSCYSQRYGSLRSLRVTCILRYDNEHVGELQIGMYTYGGTPFETSHI